MTQATQTQPEPAIGDDVVLLTVPADGGYLGVLRTATAGLAARLHFALDEIEDLFVKPEARGHGLGKQLLDKLVTIARERGYGRVEWSVLDWNEPAIGFYRAIGAVPNNDWTDWSLLTRRRTTVYSMMSGTL